MLRECVRYEALAKILLQSEQFYEFFKYVEVSNFDIASDAYSTFKVILKYYFIGTCVELHCLLILLIPYFGYFCRTYWLDIKCYQQSFWKQTTTTFLISIRNCLILKITWQDGSPLSCWESFCWIDITILWWLNIFQVQVFYRKIETIQSYYSRSLKYSRKYNNEIFLVDNLKLMMNLLKERARNIQFEAFHVFKVHWICFRFNLFYFKFFYISRNSWLFIFMYKCFSILGVRS